MVIYSLGGGHAALPSGYLDGAHSCRYRLISLLYAGEGDSVVDLLERVTAPEAVKAIFSTFVPF
ncbi:MAG: hypothetical protein ACKVLN_06595 [Rhodobacterales bacterium]